MQTTTIHTRPRSPVKGVRQRLRVAVKARGVVGRFSTDLRRGGALVLYVQDAERDLVEGLVEFEGREVFLKPWSGRAP